MMDDRLEGQITLRQLRILKVLCEAHGAETVRAISAYLNIPKPSVTRAMDRFEGFGLGYREPDKRDNRSVNLFATNAGKAFLAKVLAELLAK